MIWSERNPNTIEYEPIGSGPESEARRSVNESAAKATFEKLKFERPWTSYHLSNNAKHIDLIEDGAAPTPERARFPSGAFRLTAADAFARIKSR
ncbi:MAG: hypothetical protein ACEQSL_05925 [Sediminibacterium sp.]